MICSATTSLRFPRCSDPDIIAPEESVDAGEENVQEVEETTGEEGEVDESGDAEEAGDGAGSGDGEPEEAPDSDPEEKPESDPDEAPGDES